MASLKIGGLTAIVSMIVGGLIVAYAWHLEWLTGIAVVAVLLFGMVISLLVAVFLPIGNMIVKVVALCVVFALFVLWGFSYLGLM
jgi:hypothetical protein